MKNTSLKLRCSLIQMDILWQQPKANLDKLELEIESLSDTDLVILPELFNTGFCFDTHLAESMNGLTVNWMQKIAQKKQCAIIGSLMILEGIAVFNRMLLVAPSGEIQHYNKRHLFLHNQVLAMLSFVFEKVLL